MGSNLDLYQEYYEANWADPPDSLAAAGERYLADEFQVLDQDGNVQMNKEAYVGMGQMLMAAFSDFRGVVDDVYQEGDSVILRSHFEGTHNGDLDLSAMGMGVIPASGKRIVWPVSQSRWEFEGDQIVSIQNMDDAGGVGGFLAPLGVTPPSG